jgi:hypothetical protein
MIAEKLTGAWKQQVIIDNGTGADGNIGKGTPSRAAIRGIQMVPAAIAAARASGVSGRDFILAVVMAYEACARVSVASKMRVSVPQHGNVEMIGAEFAS